MKILLLAIPLFLAGSVTAQNVGFGTNSPKSKLDIHGNLTVGSGSSYAGVTASPANGAIIQGQVGIGTNSPDPSTILDLSNTTRGFLIPSMTTTQMNSISAPALGLTIFNSTINCLEVNLSAGVSNWKPACN
jgi:hypothetical protein